MLLLSSLRTSFILIRQLLKAQISCSFSTIFFKKNWAIFLPANHLSLSGIITLQGQSEITQDDIPVSFIIIYKWMIEMEIASSGSESGGKIWRMFFLKQNGYANTGSCHEDVLGPSSEWWFKIPHWIYVYAFFFLVASFFCSVIQNSSTLCHNWMPKKCFFLFLFF